MPRETHAEDLGEAARHVAQAACILQVIMTGHADAHEPAPRRLYSTEEPSSRIPRDTPAHVTFCNGARLAVLSWTCEARRPADVCPRMSTPATIRVECNCWSKQL